MFSAIKTLHQGVDVCINNAGLARPEPLLSGRTEGWRTMIDVSSATGTLLDFCFFWPPAPLSPSTYFTCSELRNLLPIWLCHGRGLLIVKWKDIVHCWAMCFYLAV